MPTLIVEPSLRERGFYEDQLDALEDDLRAQGFRVERQMPDEYRSGIEPGPAFDLVVRIVEGTAAMARIADAVKRRLRGPARMGANEGGARQVAIVDGRGNVLSVVEVEISAESGAEA